MNVQVCKLTHTTYLKYYHTINNITLYDLLHYAPLSHYNAIQHDVAYQIYTFTHHIIAFILYLFLPPHFNTHCLHIGGVRVTDQVHPLKPQWSQLVVRVLSMRSFRGGNSKTSYSIWALQWRVWYVSSHTKLSHTHSLIISYTLTH